MSLKGVVLFPVKTRRDVIGFSAFLKVCNEAEVVQGSIVRCNDEDVGQSRLCWLLLLQLSEAFLQPAFMCVCEWLID